MYLGMYLGVYLSGNAVPLRKAAQGRSFDRHHRSPLLAIAGKVFAGAPFAARSGAENDAAGGI